MISRIYGDILTLQSTLLALSVIQVGPFSIKELHFYTVAVLPAFLIVAFFFIFVSFIRVDGVNVLEANDGRSQSAHVGRRVEPHYVEMLRRARLAPQVIDEGELDESGEDEGRADAHPHVDRLHVRSLRHRRPYKGMKEGSTTCNWIYYTKKDAKITHRGALTSYN